MPLIRNPSAIAEPLVVSCTGHFQEFTCRYLSHLPILYTGGAYGLYENKAAATFMHFPQHCAGWWRGLAVTRWSRST